MNTKFCKKCFNEKSVSLFPKNKSRKDGLAHYCTECTKKNWNIKKEKYYKKAEEYKEKNKKEITSYKKDWHYKTKYNLTLEELEELRVKQNYCCALCNKHESLTPRKSLCVDHCHITGKVRGLLCESCNQALGLFYDNTETLKRAIKYLND
jgi:hypothetical protein